MSACGGGNTSLEAKTDSNASGVTCGAVEQNLTVSVAFSNAPLWMDYIENNEANFYDAVDGVAAPRTGLACDRDEFIDGGSRNGETGYHEACIHGGEIRRVPTVETSCTDLTAADSLGVFDWTCAVEGGVAVFYSQLKDNKGLIDLINDTTWKANQVTVSKSGCAVYESASSNTWFTNTIRNLDSLNFGAALGSATGITDVQGVNNSGGTVGGTGVIDVYNLGGTNIIYTIDEDKSLEGFILDTNKTALVVLSGSTLTFQGSGNNNRVWNGFAGNTDVALVTMGNDYGWLEGSFEFNNQANVNIYVYDNFQQIRNATIMNPDGVYAINSFRADNSRYFNITIDDTSAVDGVDHGIYDHQNHGQYYNGVTISNIQGNALRPYWNSIYRGFNIANTGNTIAFGSLNYSKFYSWRVRNSGAEGISFNGGTDLVWHDIVIFNPVDYGIRTNNAVPNTIWSRVLIVGSPQNNFYFVRHDNNTVQFVTTTFSGDDGINWHQTADDNRFSQILAVANASDGLGIEDGSNNDLYQLLAGHNANYGVNLGNVLGNNMSFFDNLFIGSNGVAGCLTTNATHTIDVGTTACTHGSGTLTVTSKNLTSSFVGRVTSDSSNADFIAGDDDGNGMVPYNNIDDFGNWDNQYRGFARAASTSAVDASNAGNCTAGNNCAAWDWRLRSTDTEILNINGAFTNGAACPVSVHGNEVITDANLTAANTYLKNAYERVFDGIGDDDGLCESNEACIYAPNIGYYQGEGELGTCTFAGGTVTGVTMYGYLTNGAN